MKTELQEVNLNWIIILACFIFYSILKDIGKTLEKRKSKQILN